MRSLLLLFVTVPILEIWVLIKVGSQIGALSTVGIVLLTAMIGVALLRQQGVSTLMRARQRLEKAEVPAREVAEGVIIAVGGALLLTPGFITDAIGFACLIPASRRFFIRWILSHLSVRPAEDLGGSSFSSRDFPPSPHRPPTSRGKTLEGEYRRDD